MNSRTVLLTAAIVTSLTLGGCDKVKSLLGGGKDPSGQVVATVNGEEITTLELRQELGGFNNRDPAVMKAAQQQALQQIILRKLIVQKAKEQKLDKSREYSLQVKRGEEGLLTQLYQRKIAATASPPTRQEADTLIASQPDRFENRKIMVVEQVAAAPNKIAPDRFRPLKTLDEVKSLLAAENVPYQTNVATLDTLSVDGRLLAQLNKLPPGEVFVIPQRGSLLFNRIVDTRAEPFRGDAAVNYATNLLRNQKAQQAVARDIEAMRKGAESKITYNAAFKPPPPSAKKPAAPAAATPAAPAAAAPTAAAPAAAPATK